MLPKRLLNTPFILELKLFLCLMLLLLGDEVEEVVGEMGFSDLRSYSMDLRASMGDSENRES